jgi:DNA-binding CsgD family transcriptional regulator
MRRLSHSDLNNVSDVLRELYAQTDSQKLPHLTLDLLDRLIPCVSIAYNSMEAHNAPAQADQALRLFPALMENMHEHPVVAYQNQGGDKQPSKLSDFLNNQQFRRTTIYNEFYGPLNIRYLLALYFPGFGQQQIPISLHRWDKDFSERDRAILVHLGPHFTQAHKNANAFSNVKLETEQLNRALQTTSQELVLLTRAGHVQWLTERGRNWLDVYFNTRSTPDESLPDDLLRWVRRQCQQFSGETLGSPLQPLEIERGNRRLTVRLNQSSPGELKLLLNETRTGIVPEALQRLGLTHREAEVLGWLVGGKSNPEIALILGMSPRTAEKHLENIFSKLGVENRFAAVALVRSNSFLV